MSKKQPTEEKQNPTSTDSKTQTTAVSTTVAGATELFSRQINNRAPVKSLSLKQTLTKPLIAMAHVKQLLFECKGEMYTMTLPAKGRGAAPSVACVVDGIDLEKGDDVTLVFNAMMISALKQGGFKVLSVVTNEKDESSIVETTGTPLTGHGFAFKRGDINEDKGYRHVDVVEIGIER